MILLYLLFFALGVLSYLVTRRFSTLMRIVVALSVFIIPSVIATIWILKVGDKPAPNSKTIYPDASPTSPEGSGNEMDEERNRKD